MLSSDQQTPKPNTGADMARMPNRSASPSASDTARSIRSHLIFGTVVLALLFGGVGGWAAIASVESAVMAPGTVVVKGAQKRVQHERGGTVARIHVRDGEAVREGDLIIQLEPGQIEAETAAFEKRRFDLMMRRRRLVAERDSVAWPPLEPELEAMIAGRPELADLVAIQRKLLQSRASLAERRDAQLRERIVQAQRQMSGMEAIAEARELELEVLSEEMAGLEQLREKGLVQISRYNNMKRSIADKKGQIGQVRAQIAEVGGKIAEIEIRLLEVAETAQDEALSALENIETELTQVDEQLAGLRDRREKLDIRATADGVIHELKQHTIGGVIRPGDTVALVIPTSDDLVVDANLQIIDRDQVEVGQEARVRFSAFNQRTTPELSGTVAMVASDQSLDPNSRVPFFKVRVVLAPDEVEKLGTVDVVPGMPADVMLTSQDRTVISYLLKPVVDQFERVFREE